MVIKKEKKLNQFLKKSHNLRRQKTQNFFLPNGAIYITDTTNFKKDFFSNNTLFYEMDYKSSIDIDSKDDLNFIRNNYE